MLRTYTLQRVYMYTGPYAWFKITIKRTRIAKMSINTQSIGPANKCTIDVQRDYCAYKLLAINAKIKIDFSTYIRVLHATKHTKFLRLEAHLPHHLKIDFCLKNIPLLTLDVLLSICGLFNAGMHRSMQFIWIMYLIKIVDNMRIQHNNTTSYWWLCRRCLFDIDFANTNNINFNRCSRLYAKPKSIDDGCKTWCKYANAPTLFG